MKVKSLSRVQLFKAPWTAAYQAPPSMGFSRQEYWSGASSSGTSIIRMLVHLILSQRSLRLSSVLFFFSFFTLFCSSEDISTSLSSSSLIHSSASDILLLLPSRVFLISIIVLFVFVCLFFNPSTSLLIDSCVFSRFVFKVFDRLYYHAEFFFR